MHDKLTKIRELVDELFDNTQPHSSTNSMLFLEINQAIDEAQKKDKLVENLLNEYKLIVDKINKSRFINGVDLDCNNEEQVNDIMAKMKKERKY